MRQKLFLDSYWQVQNTNQLYTGTDEVNFGLNRFSDWTDEEYEDLMLSGTYIPGTPIGPPVPDWPVQDESLASSVNWVDENVVGDVRDQWYDGSSCVSNYAIASVAALESANAIENDLTTETTYELDGVTPIPPTFVRLSAQQVVSCSDAEGNMACDGGSHTWAMDYMWDNAIHTAEDYPYTGLSDSCDTTVTDDATLDTVQASIYRRVSIGNTNALMAEVA